MAFTGPPGLEPGGGAAPRHRDRGAGHPPARGPARGAGRHLRRGGERRARPAARRRSSAPTFASPARPRTSTAWSRRSTSRSALPRSAASPAEQIARVKTAQRRALEAGDPQQRVLAVPPGRALPLRHRPPPHPATRPQLIDAVDAASGARRGPRPTSRGAAGCWASSGRPRRPGRPRRSATAPAPDGRVSCMVMTLRQTPWAVPRASGADRRALQGGRGC